MSLQAEEGSLALSPYACCHTSTQLATSERVMTTLATAQQAWLT